MGQKDQFGVNITFYAVLAFVLAILGQTLLCGLLLGFSILSVRDQWLMRQVMQAFFLCFITSIVGVFTGMFAMFKVIPILGGMITGLVGFVGGIISIIVFIFALISLIQVSKGQEADLPIARKLADRAFG